MFRRSQYYLLIAVIAIGLGLQMMLLARSWIRGDQVALFDLGRIFAHTGQLLPVAKQMSGGGSIPGCLLQLLVGIPLKIWPYFKAPYVMVGLFHIAALIILLVALNKARGMWYAAFFLAIYWLSPWRLYHSGFLWEPSFMVLPAALHLWACWNLKDHPKMFPSAVLLGILLLSLQIHASSFILVILSILLVIRKHLRIDWRGALLGAMCGFLPLIPTIYALLSGHLPETLPKKSFLGYGLLRIHPVLKGILYWFRMSSLDIGRRYRHTIFFNPEWMNGSIYRQLMHEGAIVLAVLATASVFLAVVATWWFFRPKRKALSVNDPSEIWIRSYVMNSFFSVVIAAALSPVTMQGWYMIVILHAACLPVVSWMDEHWKKARSWIKLTIILFIILRIPVTLAFGLGHNMYRRTPIPEKQLSGFRRIREYLPADVREELEQPMPRSAPIKGNNPLEDLNHFTE